MVEWLSTKAYEKLTDEEIKAELENLLRNCEDEKEFDEECRRRFGELKITVTWSRSVRMATVLKESIHASVTIE